MKNTISNLPIVLALGLSQFACSNSDDHPSGATHDSGPGHSGTGGSAAGGSSGGAAGDPHHGSGGTSGAPSSGGMGGMMMDGSMMMDGASGMHAPMIQSVMPMSGGLHVVWTNVMTDCDKIELLRNKDGGAYAVAYTLTGAATSQHDTQATSPGTYCYKARCVKGTQTSPESNEKCGTP